MEKNKRYNRPQMSVVSISTSCVVCLSLQNGKSADPESPVFSRGYAGWYISDDENWADEDSCGF